MTKTNTELTRLTTNMVETQRKISQSRCDAHAALTGGEPDDKQSDYQ